MALTQKAGERTRVWPMTTALLALLVLSLALAPRAEAFIYWTNGDSIGRANLDGTGLNSHFIAVSTDGAYPRDLTLDGKNVYWAAACFSEPPTVPCTNGAIGRADLDGTSIDERLIGGINPGGVAVDAKHVYWAWSDCDGGWGIESLCTSDELLAGPGGIAPANLDGSGVDQNFISGIDADQLTVDADHIYWTEKLCEPGCQTITSGIGRANLDGTGVEPGFIGGLPRGITGLNALALDTSHIYWTGQVHDDFNLGPALGRANLDGTGVDPTFLGGATGWHYTDAGTIGRANLDGTEVAAGFITGAAHPDDLAIDSDHVYWVNTAGVGGMDHTGTIGRANLDGTSVDQSFITTTSVLPPTYSQGGVAVDHNHIYWTNRTASAIGRASLDGTNVDQSFITGAGLAEDVAVDGGHVYWADWEWGDYPPEDFSPPKTKITKHPKNKVVAKAAKAKVKFAFESSESGSSFKCKLNKKDWKACHSPKHYRAKSPASTGSGFRPPTRRATSTRVRPRTSSRSWGQARGKR